MFVVCMLLVPIVLPLVLSNMLMHMMDCVMLFGVVCVGYVGDGVGMCIQRYCWLVCWWHVCVYC